MRRDGPAGPVPERLRLVVAGLRPQWLPRARSLRVTSDNGPAACSARRGSDGVARHLHMGEKGFVGVGAGFPHGPAALRPRSPMCSSPPRPGIVGPDPVMRLPDGRRTVENLVLWSIDGTDEGCDRAVIGPTRPPTLRHSASPTFELDRSRRRRQRGLRGVAGGPAVCHRPGGIHAGR